jgi:hypothetical protein
MGIDHRCGCFVLIVCDVHRLFFHEDLGLWHAGGHNEDTPPAQSPAKKTHAPEFILWVQFFLYFRSYFLETVGETFSSLNIA